MATRLAALLQARAHLAEAGLRRRITQAAGSPAVLPDLPLQLGAPGDGGGVAYAIQFGIADQVAELTQFGQDRRCFRVGGGRTGLTR